MNVYALQHQYFLQEMMMLYSTIQLTDEHKYQYSCQLHTYDDVPGSQVTVAA